jgi:hypothetical protein
VHVYIREEVIVVKPTTIGTPKIIEYRNRIYLPFSQIEDAIYCIAALCEEDNWNGVTELIERAKSAVMEGVATLPAFSVALLSRAATGSYTQGRDEVNRAFAADGRRNYYFEHNPEMGTQSRLLYPAHITIQPASADHQMVYLDFKLRTGSKVGMGLEVTPEQSIADVLGVRRVLRSVEISTPLEIVNGMQYRLDLAPFADVLRNNKFEPGEYMHISKITGGDFANWFERWINSQTNRYNTPQIALTIPGQDVKASLGTSGCEYVDYDTWEQDRTILSTRTGTEFTGPIRTKVTGNELETPHLWLSLNAGGSHLPDREQLLLQLAKQSVSDIVDYHL